MSFTLICGKHVVCKTTGRTDALVTEAGAVFREDGVIVAGPLSGVGCRAPAGQGAQSRSGLGCDNRLSHCRQANSIMFGSSSAESRSGLC